MDSTFFYFLLYPFSGVLSTVGCASFGNPKYNTNRNFCVVSGRKTCYSKHWVLPKVNQFSLCRGLLLCPLTSQKGG